MKTSLHLIIALVFVVAGLTVQAQYTHHSNPGGGNWADPATWLEGTAPSALDSVVIRSTVLLSSYTNLCNSMLVADTGMVGWASGGGHIIINGSIYNKGSIGTGLYILYGDIYNDSVIGGIDAVVKFQGSDHSISCAPGKSIDAQFIAEDSLQNIILNSDLEINDRASILGNSELFTQNHVLRINGGSLQDCRIHAFDSLVFNSTIGNLVVSGNYKLKGTMDILGRLDLKDEGVNHGTIRSLYGAASDLNLAGNFVNEGTIESSAAGNLNVNVMNIAANNGIWNGNVTKFIGSAQKHISQSSGHPFGGTQITTDNSGSVIILDSDAEFTAQDITLYNDTLSCGNHILTANSTFNHGIITSESEIKGNSDFWTTSFKGNLLFSGNPRFSNCSTYGNIENTGHMQDITYYGGIYSSYGLLDNKGDIQGIHFNIYGNLSNNGNITDNCIVDVVGDNTQYILLTNSIESQCNFYSEISGNSYQWMLNGADILNQQAQYLFFNTLQISDAGVYQCRVTTDQGTVYSREIIVNNVTAVPENPKTFSTLNLFPNPCQGATTLSYTLSEVARVKVEVTDIKGISVINTDAGLQNAGYHSLLLNCNGLQPGTYFCRIQAKGCMEVKKFSIY